MLQVDCLPMFVNDQWRQESCSQDAPPPQPPSARGSSCSTLPAVVQELDSDLYNQELLYLAGACPGFRSSALAHAAPSDNMFCGAYIADGHQLCRRVNTLQSLLEVNREMANLEITGTCLLVRHLFTCATQGSEVYACWLDSVLSALRCLYNRRAVAV